MKLIPEWRSAHRFLSVQLTLAAGAVQTTWPLIPDDLRSALPAGLVHVVSVFLLTAAVAGRLLDQGIAADAKDPK
jgi:hypothetical protein